MFAKYKQKFIRVAINQSLILGHMEAAYTYLDDKEVCRLLSADKDFQLALGAALRRAADRAVLKGATPHTPQLVMLASAKRTAGHETDYVDAAPQNIPASLMPTLAKAGYAGRIDAEKVAQIVAKIAANGHDLATMPRDTEQAIYTADFRECTPKLRALIETVRPNEGDPRRSKSRLFFEKISFAVKNGLHL